MKKPSPISIRRQLSKNAALCDHQKVAPIIAPERIIWRLRGLAVAGLDRDVDFQLVT